jgi:hypothetical protein
VAEEKLNFLEVLVRFNLLWGSMRINAQERQASERNQLQGAYRGRVTGLLLQRDGTACLGRATNWRP